MLDLIPSADLRVLPPEVPSPGDASSSIGTVSERLGHASETVTLTVYSHVMPGDQKRAAGRFAALIREA